VRVLVTGASGFLGRSVVAALLDHGHRVRATIRPATSTDRLHWVDDVELFRGDLRVTPALHEAFEDVDVAVHLAAVISPDHHACLADTITGTERLLDAMAGSATGRLILISSFAVYDTARAGRTLTERSRLAFGQYDRGGYAMGKLWQERLVRRAAERHGWRLTVLRPGFIWGPENIDLACIGQRIGRTHLVFGPRRRLPLTYVDNCADAVVKAVDSPAATGRTFNVIDSNDITVGRYLAERNRRLGESERIVPLPYWTVATGVKAMGVVSRLLFGRDGKLPDMFGPTRFASRFKPMRVSTDRLARQLGWSPPLDFETCLERCYASA